MTANTKCSASTLLGEHPCYTESAARTSGRMHLPVAHRCNLGCNYCERAIGVGAAVYRGPGSSRSILSPQAASALADRVAGLGWLRVVGIAGPGEPLANPETFETLRVVRAAHRDLLLCLSTNGLDLEQSLPELLRAGLKALTVTINTTSPETAARLYGWAQIDGRRVTGEAAAPEILLRQWRGLAAAAEAGLLIKVNSVLIPGVNTEDLPAVARDAAYVGAHRHNIMPLIPRGRMRNMSAPSQHELEAVREECARWLPQFRGCIQCPADAIVPPSFAKGGAACAAECCASSRRSQ
jgi:nitrogen fixation protein NifB